MIELTLYSTSHCHLCEEAEALLLSLKNQYDIKWITSDIVYDDDLLRNYAIKIPVIKRNDNQAEISWPFTTKEIAELINRSSVPQNE